jgi:hypothetical protein
MNVHGRTPTRAAWDELVAAFDEADAAVIGLPAPPANPKPKVVCLIGSTRFRKEFERAFYNEEHAGRICLTVPCYKDDPCCKTLPEQVQLDTLHLAKIEMADEILCINVGESTRWEIDYCRKLGKTIRWLEPESDAPAPPAPPAPAGDEEKDDRYKPLYRKFDVRRTDGSGDPGGKHEHCTYFVLDMEHDRFAVDALEAYSKVCWQEYPALSEDLRRWVAGVRSGLHKGSPFGEGGPPLAYPLAPAGRTAAAAVASDLLSELRDAESEARNELVRLRLCGSTDGPAYALWTEKQRRWSAAIAKATAQSAPPAPAGDGGSGALAELQAAVHERLNRPIGIGGGPGFTQKSDSRLKRALASLPAGAVAVPLDLLIVAEEVMREIPRYGLLQSQKDATRLLAAADALAALRGPAAGEGEVTR